MSKEKTKKKWGDRRDGKLIKVPAMAKIMTYVKNREEAYVYINRKFDVTELIKYMKKKKQNESNILPENKMDGMILKKNTRKSIFSCYFWK